MAAPTVVASTAHGYSTDNTAVTAAINTTGATKLVVGVVCENTNNLAVTDNKGNTFALIGSVATASNYPSYFALYESTGTPVVGTNHIFTATATYGYPTIAAVAVAPSAGGALSLAVAKGADTASPYTSPALACAECLALGFYAPLDTQEPTITWGNSFSVLAQITSTAFWQLSLASRAISTSGNYNTSVTDNRNPTQTYSAIVSITEASSAFTVPVWNGSAWVAREVRRWTGSAWEAIKGIRRWNGSTWEP